MKLHALAVALIFAIGSSLAHAQSGGSTGGGASSGGAGAPAAGSAGAGSLGISGVPRGPGNAAGLNNSGNDPSGAGHAPAFNSGTTTGLANPSGRSPAQGSSSNGEQRNAERPPPRGTSSSGTASSSGGGRTVRSNGTTMPGPDSASTTDSKDSDAKIDAENKKLDQMVKSICRGC